MSKWVEIRDSIEDALNFGEVTNDMKDNLTTWMLTTGKDMAQGAADKFCAALKEDAKTETGWSKIRDSVALPVAINGAIWIIDQVLTRAQKEGAK